MSKLELQQKRKNRVRAKISGTTERPRLTVHKSNKHIYAQLIDDSVSKTIVALHDSKVEVKGNKSTKALELGKRLGKLAQEKNVKSVVFDRNSYKYHGIVKAVAEGARQSGLLF